MTRRTLYATAIAAAAFCLLVAPASATHVQCGDTITATTTLDSDVQCAAGEPYGLIIGASNVKVLLNGYTVRGVSDGNEAGIYSPCCVGPFPSRVSIKGGAIEGFTNGVYAGLDDSVLHKLNFRNTEFAVRLTGDRNTLTNNVVREGRSSNWGLLSEGDDAYVWGNSYIWTGLGNVVNAGPAIQVVGDRGYVVNNLVDCQAEMCGDSGYAGLSVIGDTADSNARVSQNTVRGDYAWGLYVHAVGARVTQNESIGHFRNIEVEGASVVGSNVANNFAPFGEENGVGILVLDHSVLTTVRNNTTNNNEGYGIFAVDVADVIDGGGNTASGNGNGNTPQCVGVQCSSP